MLAETLGEAGRTGAPGAEAPDPWGALGSDVVGALSGSGTSLSVGAALDVTGLDVAAVGASRGDAVEAPDAAAGGQGRTERGSYSGGGPSGRVWGAEHAARQRQSAAPTGRRVNGATRRKTVWSIIEEHLQSLGRRLRRCADSAWRWAPVPVQPVCAATQPARWACARPRRHARQQGLRSAPAIRDLRSAPCPSPRIH